MLLIHGVQFLFGIVLLILDIWAIIDVITSHKTAGVKVLWILLILFLPLVGLIIYAILGHERLAST